MGLFGDLFREVASEIGTAFIEGINEANEREEEKKQLLETYKMSCSSASLEELRDIIENDDDEDYKEVAKKTIQQRKQFVLKAKNGMLQETLSEEYSDDRLVAEYIDLCDEGKDRYGQDIELVTSLFLKEISSRPSAVKSYEEGLSDSFDCYTFSYISDVLHSDSYKHDMYVKAEAASEIMKRNAIASQSAPDNLEAMDNDEFLEYYNLVRTDKTKFYYREGKIIEENQYFGQKRDDVLKNCEYEMFENRKYLMREFVDEYCEDETDEYINYSNKKLEDIINWDKSKIVLDEVNSEAKEFDKIDKYIAFYIIESRKKEEE